jgi:hypothetical protein
VTWLLPFLALAPSAGLLLLTVTCNLSYLCYAHHTFPAWIPLAEYAPVYLLLGWQHVNGLREKGMGSRE